MPPKSWQRPSRPTNTGPTWKIALASHIIAGKTQETPFDKRFVTGNKASDTLTLAELEEKSRRFANSITRTYDIKPNDVVGILARDKV
ncbi:MAG: hypothetical protein Q9179_005689 [Wetmoreana sp. 5 TL-2023]